MRNPAYVVTVETGGAVHKKVWNGRKRFAIGHPARWVIERSKEGVTVKSVAGSKLELVRGWEDSELVKGAEFSLTGAAKPVAVRLEQVRSLPAVYETHHGKSGELCVYACRGRTPQNFSRVGVEYVGQTQAGPVFRMKKVGSTFQVESLSASLKVCGKPVAASMKINVMVSELRGSSISAGDAHWRFETQVIPTLEAFEKQSESQAREKRELKRSMLAAVAAVLFFLMLLPFLPKSEQEEILPTQMAKIATRVPHHRAASAPMGSTFHDTRAARLAGPAKQQKLAQNKKAATHKTAVAHHKAAPVKQKAVAQHQAPKAAPKKVAQHATPVAQPAPKKVVAKVAPAPAPKFAGTLGGETFQAEARKALKNNAAFAAADSRSGSQASDRIFHSQSSALAGGAPSDGTVGARSVTLVSLGGGQGDSTAGVPGYGRGSHGKVNGQGHSFVSMDTQGADVDDGLSLDEVGAVIHRHLSEVRYCYEAATLRNPAIEGRVAVHFVIAPKGQVATAKTSESDVSDAQLGECIVKRLRQWGFPHPRNGGNVAVNYPFVFKTLGR